MDARPRSTLVAPIPRPATIHHHRHLPFCSSPPPLLKPHPTAARPSSSRLPPPPSPLNLASSLSTSPADTLPRTHSSASVFSDSSVHTPPGPITPPDGPHALGRLLEYYASPPSPPRSLQDQMHVAYALDNMHLAKVLLLKLQGIDVDGDDDPRIAAVRDEDFSSSFLPHGGLRLDPDTELRIQQAESRAHHAWLRAQRDDRLRHCQRVWDHAERRYKSAKDRVARDKLVADTKRRDQLRELKERDRDRARKAEAARVPRAPHLRIASAQPRQLLSYDSLRHADARFPKPSPPKDEDTHLFLYDIMPSSPTRTSSPSPPTSPSPNDKHSLSLPRVQRELALKHAKSLARSVAFVDVLTAMHGPLFEDDVTPGSSPTSRSPLQTDLLASLLEPLEKTDTQDDPEVTLPEPVPHRDKAQNRLLARVTRSSTLDSIPSSFSATFSSSPSTAARSGSWFSFGSRSSFRSDSTALTTPSSSPLATAKPSFVTAAPVSTSPPLTPPAMRAPTCRRRSTPPSAPTLLTADHPLALPTPLHASAKEPGTLGRGRPLTRRNTNTDNNNNNSPADENDPPPSSRSLVHRVGRSVSSVIDFAAGLQRAYVRATMFSAGVDLYGRAVSPSRSPSHSPPARAGAGAGPARPWRGLKPVGYRVCAVDVHAFVLGADEDEDAGVQRCQQRTMIPLLCSGAAAGADGHARARVFPVHAPLPRSPFLRREGGDAHAAVLGGAGGAGTSRLRPVANPLLLRLQALQNVCAARAIGWERAREGSLATGREKVVRVAWDGIGRSGLSWEVGVC